MTDDREKMVMNYPLLNGYNPPSEEFTSKGLSEETLDMLKTCFCLVLASWMTGVIMMAVYSREIAVFLVERWQ